MATEIRLPVACHLDQRLCLSPISEAIVFSLFLKINKQIMQALCDYFAQFTQSARFEGVNRWHSF
jgi:hypothetical protein